MLQGIRPLSLFQTCLTPPPCTTCTPADHAWISQLLLPCIKSSPTWRREDGKIIKVNGFFSQLSFQHYLKSNLNPNPGLQNWGCLVGFSQTFCVLNSGKAGFENLNCPSFKKTENSAVSDLSNINTLLKVIIGWCSVIIRRYGLCSTIPEKATVSFNQNLIDPHKVIGLVRFPQAVNSITPAIWVVMEGHMFRSISLSFWQNGAWVFILFICHQPWSQATLSLWLTLMPSNLL